MNTKLVSEIVAGLNTQQRRDECPACGKLAMHRTKRGKVCLRCGYAVTAKVASKENA